MKYTQPIGSTTDFMIYDPNVPLCETESGWVPAKPEPYYPNIIEIISCKIGIHGWPVGKKEELKRVRKYLATLSDPKGDEPAVRCYRCDKLLN